MSGDRQSEPAGGNDDRVGNEHVKKPAIPHPPSREEIEEISDAQSLITDDWTGEGGKPKS